MEKRKGLMAREWDVSVAKAGEQAKAEAVVKATNKRVKKRELDDGRAEEARLRQEEVVKAKEAARAVAEVERDRRVAEVKGCADGPGAVAVAEKVVEAARMVVELEREVAACAVWRRQRRPHTYFGLYTRATEESCLLHRRSRVRPREKERKERKRVEKVERVE